jgi:hypothetical protein
LHRGHVGDLRSIIFSASWLRQRLWIEQAHPQDRKPVRELPQIKHLGMLDFDSEFVGD